MNRPAHRRPKIRKVIAGAVVAASAAASVVAFAPSASAAPYCGPSKFVEKIEVIPWANNEFQIRLTPTGEARAYAAVSLRYLWMDPRDAVVEQWHAIQNCVPGLTGDLADKMWDQLECHQLNSFVPLPREGSIWATGDAYELESWAPLQPREASGAAMIDSKCLNDLEVDPPGGPGTPYRPDQVQTTQAATPPAQAPAPTVNAAVAWTGTDGLWLNSGPGSGGLLVVMPDGTPVTITCQTHGRAVAGPYGTTDLWDHVTAPDGQQGFASDAYINTGTAAQVAPSC